MFSLSLVSLCLVCWTVYDEYNFRVFCRKRIVKKNNKLYTSIFKAWCLGNNLREKYAFTFIQQSRSTLPLISTEAYNPEASKFRLFVENHAEVCLSRPIRSKELFLLKYGLRK